MFCVACVLLNFLCFFLAERVSAKVFSALILHGKFSSKQISYLLSWHVFVSKLALFIVIDLVFFDFFQPSVFLVLYRKW